MREIEYKLMYELEKSHWFFKARRKVLESFISLYVIRGEKKILDFGCGTGNIVEMLEAFGKVSGADSSNVAIEFCAKRRLSNIFLTKLEDRLPFADNGFDIICAFDVLEHIENDEDTLKELKRILKSGGKFFITVPAFSFWLFAVCNG